MTAALRALYCVSAHNGCAGTERDAKAMDGQTIDREHPSAEALRQERVYEQAMAELALEKQRKLAAGYAVMAGAYAFEPAVSEDGWLAKFVKFSKMFLVLALGVIPNYFVATQLLN
jgi:hypothetical protein